MNKVFLIGRLTKDPEVKVTSNGRKVAAFSIAVSNGKDAQGNELVQYFNCNAWEKLADVCENYIPKGTKVCIIGRLQNKSWEKADGSKAYATDILCNEIEILQRPNSGGDSMGEAAPTSGEESSTKKSTKPKATQPEVPEIDIDDLDVNMPF
jgi:single-strand DNA-binding protein